MKLNEIIVENKVINELGLLDKVGANMYTGLGVGGGAGLAKAAKKKFIDYFKQQLKQLGPSIKKQDALPRFVNSYMKRYGVSDEAMQNPEFQNLISQAGKEKSSMFSGSPALDKLLDNMYLLATTVVHQPSQGRQAVSTQQLTPLTNQIVGIIGKMKGSSNLDDLETVAKTAMQMLYKQNPSKYNELYKEIVSGSAKKEEPGSSAFSKMANNLVSTREPEQAPQGQKPYRPLSKQEPEGGSMF